MLLFIHTNTLPCTLEIDFVQAKVNTQ